MQSTMFLHGAPLTLSERVDQLADRLTDLPRASEHHIWEAFHVLDCLAACRQNEMPRRHFRARMEALAYFDALLFLVTRSNPPLELADLSHSGGVWSCSLVSGLADRSVCGVGAHADRNAAVLLALVAASRHSRMVVGGAV